MATRQMLKRNFMHRGAYAHGVFLVWRTPAVKRRFAHSGQPAHPGERQMRFEGTFFVNQRHYRRPSLVPSTSFKAALSFFKKRFSTVSWPMVRSSSAIRASSVYALP